MENSDWIVHRMTRYVGLKVEVLPNKKRRLMDGFTPSFGHRYVCYDCPNPQDVFDGAIPRLVALEWALADLLEEKIVNPRSAGVTEEAVGLGVGLAERFFNRRNVGHERQLAEYLFYRRALFRNQPNGEEYAALVRAIGDLAQMAIDVRAGFIDENIYAQRRGEVVADLGQDLDNILMIEPAYFVHLLVENIPALASNRDRLAHHVREEMQRLQLARRVPVDDLYDLKNNRTDSDSDKEQGRKVGKNAYNLMGALGIVVKLR